MSDLKQTIHERVKKDLADIESALLENLKPYLELVSKTAHHILFSGGKRLRPLLMVLSARLCGYTATDAIRLSTVFEYLHAATLLHDDLVDGAALRRGAPVAHTIWGNSAAVLVGDFLLARSLSIAAEKKRPEIIKVMAEVTEKMSQGEIHQLMRKGSLDLTESEYFEIIHRKTAVLIQGACKVGAVLANASDNLKQALCEYGLNLGIAFQMADDLLDYTADASTLGKEIGADLKEGKLTLPVIYALKKAEPKDRIQMEEIIKNNDFSVDEFKALVNLLNRYNGIDYSKKLAAEKIEAAKAALSVFEPSEIKNLLTHIAEYALDRDV
jgi:octaprenyl-diphosphate synthase